MLYPFCLTAAESQQAKPLLLHQLWIFIVTNSRALTLYLVFWVSVMINDIFLLFGCETVMPADNTLGKGRWAVGCLDQRM